MNLLTSQKLILVEISTLKGFSKKDFIFKPDVDGLYGKISEITFEPNKNYFLQFRESILSTNISCKYIPGKTELEYNFTYVDVSTLSFDIIKSNFMDWTDNLKIEIESDNIWNRIQENSDNIFDKDFYNSDKKFSESELKLNQERMKLLQNEILKIPLLVEQQNFIQDELKALNLKANKMSKKDWYFLLIGTFVTVSATLGLSHEQGQMILNAVKLFFSSVILIR